MPGAARTLTCTPPRPRPRPCVSRLAGSWAAGAEGRRGARAAVPRCAAQVAVIGAYWHSCRAMDGLKVPLVTALAARRWRTLNLALAAASATRRIYLCIRKYVGGQVSPEAVFVCRPVCLYVCLYRPVCLCRHCSPGVFCLPPASVRVCPHIIIKLFCRVYYCHV